MKKADFSDVRNGYGVFMNTMFLADYASIDGMKAVIKKYGLNENKLAEIVTLGSTDGAEFLLAMRECGMFETETLPFDCIESGVGDLVFYNEAHMPWDMPAWEPKTKEAAEKAISEFLDTLFQEHIKLNFEVIG